MIYNDVLESCVVMSLKTRLIYKHTQAESAEVKRQVSQQEGPGPRQPCPGLGHLACPLTAAGRGPGKQILSAQPGRGGDVFTTDCHAKARVRGHNAAQSDVSQ